MKQNAAVLVWDIYTRLFHWLFAFAIGFAWWTAEQGGDWMEWHMRCGYAVLCLFGFRLLWGLIGGRYARFSQFLHSPAATWRYAQQLKRGHAKAYTGHNPLGGWMVILLLLLGLLQAGTGLFANDDIFTEGPLVALVGYELSSRITEWHEVLFNLLLAAIVLHLLGVLFHQLVKKEALIQAMLHGKKVTADRASKKNILRGGLIFLAFSLVFFWLVSPYGVM